MQGLRPKYTGSGHCPKEATHSFKRSIYPLVLWIEVIAFLYMAGLGQEKKLTIPDSLSIQGHMV